MRVGFFVKILPAFVGVLAFPSFYQLSVLTSTLDSNLSLDNNHCGLQAPCSHSPVTFDGHDTANFNVIDTMTKQRLDYKDLLSAWKMLSNETRIIMPDAIPKTYKVQQGDITVAVHLSTRKLDRFLLLSRRWAGPISASIYISNETDISAFLSFFQTYATELYQSSFHIMMEKTELDYPHNMLRQISLDHIESDLVMILDVDFVTNPNTHSQLRQLFLSDAKLRERRRDKTLMVLPAFSREINVRDEEIPNLGNEILPATRQAVKSMVQQGAMEAFHVNRFFEGHGPTNYSKWLADDDTIPDSFYSIDYVMKFEPYVVGYREDLPRFWTGFRGFGFDKWSFFIEAHCKGFEFAVLRDFYVVHLDHALSPATQSKYTKKQMRKFKDYMLSTYGATAAKFKWPTLKKKKKSHSHKASRGGRQ